MIAVALALLSVPSSPLPIETREEFPPATFVCVLSGKPPVPYGPFRTALLVRTTEAGDGQMSISLEVADPGNIFDRTDMVNFVPSGEVKEGLSFSFSSSNWPRFGAQLSLKPNSPRKLHSGGIEEFSAKLEIETHDVLATGTCLAITGEAGVRIFDDIKKGGSQ